MLTEEEWLASDDPSDLLRHLRSRKGPRSRYVLPQWFAHYKKYQAPRKPRLFMLACARRACPAESDPACRALYDLAERFAEEPPPPLARENVLRPFYGAGPRAGALLAALRSPLGLAAAQLRLFRGRAARAAAGGGAAGVDAEREAIREQARTQSDLLRDVFGNPFRPVALDGRWLTSTVNDIARAVYGGPNFESLPILADALMDAGCGDEQVIGHCRSEGPHDRGCWVVDLLLGKS